MSKLISVEERLPQINQKVLINIYSKNSCVNEITGEASDWKEIKMARLSDMDKSNWWWCEYGCVNPECVTHWMPLPEPPSEEIK